MFKYEGHRLVLDNKDHLRVLSRGIKKRRRVDLFIPVNCVCFNTHNAGFSRRNQGLSYSQPFRMNTPPQAGQHPPLRHDPYAAFRIDAYRKYVIGWLFAAIGTQIQGVAIGWEMYQRTGEALSLGLVGLMQAVPTMVLALPAGFIADRYNRLHLVTLSMAGMTLASLGLAALSYYEGPTELMYLLLFLDASFVMFGRPARVALLPQIVPRETFANAVTWNSSLFQITSVAGPAIGGFILLWNIPAAYVICATSSLLFIIWLQRLKFRHIPPEKTEPASWQTVMAGISFIRQKRILLIIISLDLFAVLLGGAVYLLPIFAEDILHVDARGFGWLNAAPAVGSFCMAILLAHLPPMKRAGRNLLLAVGGFGLATIAFGLSDSFWLSMLMLFLTGALDNISMVIRHTLLQMLTPDRMRGRVSAVSSVFIGASNELGGLESGLVAHWFGPVFSVVSGGIGTIVVVISMAVISPVLRSLGSIKGDDDQGMDEGKSPSHT